MAELPPGAAFVTASDGVRIYAEAHGQGEPVVFSPGYCQTHENFRPQVASFVAAGFRAVLWDYRGHGRSDAPTDPAAYSMAQVVDDLGARARLGCARASARWWAGSPSAGSPRSTTRSRYPERVSALLLIASGPGFKNQKAQSDWEASIGRIADRLERVGFEGWTSGRSAPTAIGLRPELPAAQAAGRAIEAQSAARRRALRAARGGPGARRRSSGSARSAYPRWCWSARSTAPTCARPK